MSDGRLLIQVIGLQRSGNHAIICWLELLFARPLHLNDLEHDYLADPARFGEIRALPDRDCVILSFEDSGNRIAAGTPLLPHVARARSGDFPGDRLAFRYVLRDPYNCWASRAKAQDNPDGPGLTSSPRVEDFIADWKALAMLWRQDPDAFLCYNHWFRSETYRRAACARLGGRYSEASLNVVSSVGGGSSFDGYVRPSYRHILANAGSYLSTDFFGRFVRDPGGYIQRLVSPRPKGSKLSVEERWRYLLGRDDAAPLFADLELAAMSEEIFGFSVAADGSVRERVPAAAPMLAAPRLTQGATQSEPEGVSATITSRDGVPQRSGSAESRNETWEESLVSGR